MQLLGNLKRFGLFNSKVFFTQCFKNFPLVTDTMEDRLSSLEGKFEELVKSQDENSKALKSIIAILKDDETPDVGQNDQIVNHANENPNDEPEQTVSTENDTNQSDSDDETLSETPLDRLSKYNKGEKTSGEISESLANYVNKALTNKPDVKELEVLMEKYQRPKNTNFLCAPRCNIECWRLMPSSTQIQTKV